MDQGMDPHLRIRLRPWLESRLNDEWIPGLRWVDKDNSMFRIPWKHHSKHTWSEEDAIIFKDWACVTGRYREGIDTPDWPMWKTRLRCALNKAPDIQEVKQRHNLHCEEPFKVYRFISKTESLWRANACRNASMVFDGIPTNGALISSLPPQQQSLQPQVLIRRGAVGGLSSAQNKINTPTILIRRGNNGQFGSKPIALIQRGPDGEVFVKQMNMSMTLPEVGNLGSSFQHDSGAYGSSEQLDIGANQEVTGGGVGAGGGAFNNNGDYVDLPTARFSNYSQESSSFLQYPVINSANNAARRLSSVAGPAFNASTLPFLPDIMEPELHQLCLRIQHLNIRIRDTIITNPNGCCVYYGRYDETDSPTAPEPLEPPIAQHVSEKNKPYVDLLLDNMQRGLVLTASHGSIYAERLCKCAIFVYVPLPNGEYQFIRKLCRREREKIFDYEQFCDDFEYYKIGERQKPQFEIVLAFGQQLKPGLNTEGLLVWCRVANCKAWFNLQRVQSPYYASGVPGSRDQPMIQSVESLVTKYEDSDIPIAEEEQVIIEEGVEIPLEEVNDNLVYDQPDDCDYK